MDNIISLNLTQVVAMKHFENSNTTKYFKTRISYFMTNEEKGYKGEISALNIS